MAVSSGRTLRPTTKVMPGQARGHNRSLVLQSLYSDGPQSRADLARVTALTPVTIGALVSDLLAEGLAVELGTRTASRVGKPATLVGFDPGAAHIVSIDLSPDQRVRGAVLDLNGTILSSTEVDRVGKTGTAAVDLVTDLAGRLVAGAERPVLGVGVGSPGVVDSSGTVLDAPNLGWTRVPLAAKLRTALERPVHVANDADAAALAEHSFGGAGAAGVLVVTVGLGVGAGILLDGALVRGERFAAGEIGHVTVEERGADCACGRTGCLETVLAAPQLRSRLDGLDAAGQRRVLANAGKRLGVALAPVISTLDLGAIVLNGPPDLLGGPLLESLSTTVRRRVMPVVAEALDIRLSTLHENSVLLGASVLVLSGQLGVS
jgi:predicted NBD/HSP70 family sugar kinase